VRHIPLDEAFETPSVNRAYPIPDLIELLGFRRASGKIQITEASESFGIFVERGRIRAATSSLRTLRLGHLLLQRGAVEPVFLHDVLHGRRSLPGGRALGATLVEEGAVSRADLVATVEEQIIEILSRLLTVRDATVRMMADEPLPEGIEVADFDTDALLEEANSRHARRAAMRAMQRLLPAHNAELALTIQLALFSFQLSDSELLVALQIDKGSMTLERLGSIVPLEPLTLKRAVITLFERGYLATKSR
jgi:Domain of unknown function (DUF4388)